MFISISQVTFLVFKNLSYCLNSTPSVNRCGLMPRSLSRKARFHLCHLHHPEGLLSESLWGHNSRECDLDISPALEAHFLRGRQAAVYIVGGQELEPHSCLLPDMWLWKIYLLSVNLNSSAVKWGKFDTFLI